MLIIVIILLRIDFQLFTRTVQLIGHQYRKFLDIWTFGHLDIKRYLMSGKDRG